MSLSVNGISYMLTPSCPSNQASALDWYELKSLNSLPPSKATDERRSEIIVVGLAVIPVVGFELGVNVGDLVGRSVGEAVDGKLEGVPVGTGVGEDEGAADGGLKGILVGIKVGGLVGFLVGDGVGEGDLRFVG